MNRETRPRLSIEHLEDRTVPSTFGVAWPDPGTLSVSFADDGTIVGTQSSQLHQLMEASSSSGDWQLEILRALQTWASLGNVNLTLTEDGGQAFGSTGALQGDTRFGDFRVGAVELSPEQLASSQPFSLMAGSWSGDILFNTAYTFGDGGGGSYDLYSVALQEAGHAFGLGNSDDMLSVMYDDYQGSRTQLTAGDIAAFQHLYGVRRHDDFDSVSRNDKSASATTLDFPRTSYWSRSSSTTVEADLTTMDDVDWYRFTATDSGWVNIDLKTSDISLLTAKMALFDSDGDRLERVVSKDPTSGDLSLRVYLHSGETYALRIKGATDDVFDVGAYQLRLSTGDTDYSHHYWDFGEYYARDSFWFRNDSMYSATSLDYSNWHDQDARFDFHYRGTVDSDGDHDFYRFRVPQGASAGQALTVSLWAIDPDLAVRATVLDEHGNRVDSEVLLNENGGYALQVRADWQAGTTYYIDVAASDSSEAREGRYFLGVAFTTALETNSRTIESSLDQSKPQEAYRLNIEEGKLFHFGLAAKGAENAGVRMTVYDELGNVVHSLTVLANETVTSTFWLGEGTYTVVFAGGTKDGSTLGELAYTAKLSGLSDSIDPYLIDTTGEPTEEPPLVSTEAMPTSSDPISEDETDYYWEQYYSAMLFLESTDPYSDPFWY